ncbi:MAG TPA: hypothetical protein VMN77_01570 [Nitrospiria bacterium]|jgi:hypothetical protein|nr:hypothetical protein [Nitrospiria bacterium]
MVRKKRHFIALFLAVGGLFGCAEKYITSTEPARIEKESVGAHWEAGVAIKDITPQKAVYLAGFQSGRVSKGVHDPLSARCFVLSNGKTRVGIVSMDLIGMLGPDIVAIKRGVPALAPEHIIVSFTHTHSGPDTTGLWGFGPLSGRDGPYMRETIDAAAACLNDAMRDMQDITLHFGSTTVQYSRFKHDLTIPDPAFTVMRATRIRDGKEEALFTLVNYAVHPTIMRTNFITADFVGSFYEHVRELGGGMGIFMNGTQGHVGPAIKRNGEDDWPAADRFGRMIGDTAMELHTVPSADYAITVRDDVLRVPLANPWFKIAAFFNKVPDPRNGDDHTIPLELSYVKMGELTLLTIPGEAFPNIGKDLRRDIHAPFEMLCGLCNGAYGYIMYPSDYENKNYSYWRGVSLGPIGDAVYRSLVLLGNN